VIAEDNGFWAGGQEYHAKLTPEMQLWWTSHLRPKYAELTNISLGSATARRAAWHVRTIAVHPEKQRRGVARRLLEEAVLKRADAGKQKSVMETHTDALVRIFAKFGFKAKGTKNFGSYQGGFPLFCMVREPKPPAN